MFLLALLLLLCAASGTVSAAGEPPVEKPGGAEGVLTGEDGKPVEGAEVYFYVDPDRRFRGPADFMAEPTGPDGKYITELPPGRYYAVARKRASGSISGNLQKGDWYSREGSGPFEIKAGEYVKLNLTLVKLTGNMLFNAFPGKGGGQGVRGVIKDRDGKPAARAYAFAYKDSRMVGKPDYVSEWTREDGTYVIYTDGPGVYYVGARTGFMGVPKPDEPYGRYGAGDHSVTVNEGGFTGSIDIVLKRFSDSR
ncbi:MAG: hypothetical protein ABSG42_01800 [Nitrospirota bacterium]